MQTQIPTTTPTTTERSELARIRNDLAHALRTVTPDPTVLHSVLQRLDALISISPAVRAPAATAQRSDHVTRGLFAGW